MMITNMIFCMTMTWRKTNTMEHWSGHLMLHFWKIWSWEVIFMNKQYFRVWVVLSPREYPTHTYTHKVDIIVKDKELGKLLSVGLSSLNQFFCTSLGMLEVEFFVEFVEIELSNQLTRFESGNTLGEFSSFYFLFFYGDEWWVTSLTYYVFNLFIF